MQFLHSISVTQRQCLTGISRNMNNNTSTLAQAVVEAPKYYHASPIEFNTVQTSFSYLKALTTAHSLISVQPPRGTRSSSVVTLSRTLESSLICRRHHTLDLSAQSWGLSWLLLRSFHHFQWPSCSAIHHRPPSRLPQYQMKHALHHRRCSNAMLHTEVSSPPSISTLRT